MQWSLHPSILSGEGQKENPPIQINSGCT